MSAEVLAFPGRAATLEAEMRVEAVRAGRTFDEFLVDLALEGFRLRQRSYDQFVNHATHEFLAAAQDNKIITLHLLKQVARHVLAGTFPAVEDLPDNGPDKPEAA